MFTINTEYWNQKPVYTLCHPSGAECTLFAGASGAIQNTYLLHQGQKVQVTWGATDADEWNLFGHKLYPGNVLFPFPNRVKDGKYTLDNTSYQLPINEPARNNAIHGLVAFETCLLKEQVVTENFAKIVLEYTIIPTDSYPFAIQIQNTYILRLDALEIDTICTSFDKKPAPIGLGWHPYFTLPGDRKDWSLELPPCKEQKIDAQFIPTGEEVGTVFSGKAKKLEKTLFDTGFRYTGDGSDKITTHLSNGKQIIHIEQEGYPFIQIYTPPDKNSIAIEPMTCATDAFNNGLGLKILKPNTTIKMHWAIRLK